MKRNKLLTTLTSAAIVLIAGSADAQPAGPTTTPKPEDDAIVLSPFVVNTEKDIGYAAKNTLAGTRLNTSLDDIGASISIYTKDLLNDLSATNANELLIYGAGTEAGGAQGNFSGAATDINANFVLGDNVRTNPQGATRIRGLAAPSFSRGLFSTNIPIDSFNTESVTVNRGPNAILFGVSNPAGIVDTTLIQPNLRRNLNKVDLRYGNNDSFRSSLDVNRVLVPQKLALRFAAVDDREKFNQRPAFENKQRIYGAMTAKPFRSSTLRADFEAGRTRANRPFSMLPLNSISKHWYEAGRPVFDWTFFDDPARNPNAAAQSAHNATSPGRTLMGNYAFNTQIAIVYSRANAKTPDDSYKNALFETTSTAAAADMLRANLFHPLVNKDSTSDGIFALPGTFNLGELGPVFEGGVRPAGRKNQGFTDFSAFDFENRQIDETARQHENFHTFHVALEQLAWKDRLGIELAYYTERFDRRSNNPFITGNGSGHIRIDPNVTLFTGQPNRNVGRPFMMNNQSQLGHTFSNRETARVTAFARYDFRDASPRLGQWLGRHTLTGLYDKDATETLNYAAQFSTYGVAADTLNPDPGSFARASSVRVYIGDSVLDGRPLKLEPIQIPQPAAGLSHPTPYFAAPAGSPAQGDYAVATTTLAKAIVGGRAAREVIKSQAAVLQSYWLGGHLVTTLGWRRDEDYFASRAIAFNPADPRRVDYGFNDFNFASTPPPNVSKEVKTYSAVLRWPQKLVRLSWGANAAIFINASENFTPIGGRINPYGEPLASPQGETREYGLNLSFLNDRFSLRVNRFETSIKGQSFNSYGGAINNAVLQHTGFWATEQNINPHIDRSADIALMYSALPANFRQIHTWRISGTAADKNLSFTHQVAPGVSDTTDYTAKGTEFELTFNPTRQWRFIANVSNQETVQTNIAPGLREFLARIRPVWAQLADRPTSNYPSGHVLGTPLPVGHPGGNHGDYVRTIIDAPLAVILASEGTANPELSKWRSNLVANYTFAQEGRLKGWSAGTGVRWQDKFAIGYPGSFNAVGGVVYDIKHPYFAPAKTNVDLFAAYTRKIWKDRIDWKVQLNVRNAIADDDPIGVTVQPTGEYATVRLAPERRWYLTNTFSF